MSAQVQSPGSAVHTRTGTHTTPASHLTWESASFVIQTTCFLSNPHHTDGNLGAVVYFSLALSLCFSKKWAECLEVPRDKNNNEESSLGVQTYKRIWNHCIKQEVPEIHKLKTIELNKLKPSLFLYTTWEDRSIIIWGKKLEF